MARRCIIDLRNEHAGARHAFHGYVEEVRAQLSAQNIADPAAVEEHVRLAHRQRDGARSPVRPTPASFLLMAQRLRTRSMGQRVAASGVRRFSLGGVSERRRASSKPEPR
jgi:hypothetical protein